ncbi:MAG: hypothetical protein FWF56_00755 [Firmicutes bacterium]|nr:hypothetical protein [Bacillota bacterium]MCL1953181.1 hypothetical protein [Bacillota bacterium]
MNNIQTNKATQLDVAHQVVNRKKLALSGTKFVARVAVLAGLMVASKLAVYNALPFASFIDLTAVILIASTMALGFRTGITTSIVFILLGAWIWSVGWWLLTWVIWYPALALSVAFLPKTRFSWVFAAIIGTVFAIAFALLSSFLYVLTSMDLIGEGQNLFSTFWAFYISGAVATWLGVLSWVITLFLLTRPLTIAIERIDNIGRVH